MPVRVVEGVEPPRPPEEEEEEEEEDFQLQLSEEEEKQNAIDLAQKEAEIFKLKENETVQEGPISRKKKEEELAAETDEKKLEEVRLAKERSAQVQEQVQVQLQLTDTKRKEEEFAEAKTSKAAFDEEFKLSEYARLQLAKEAATVKVENARTALETTRTEGETSVRAIDEELEVAEDEDVKAELEEKRAAMESERAATKENLEEAIASAEEELSPFDTLPPPPPPPPPPPQNIIPVPQTIPCPNLDRNSIIDVDFASESPSDMYVRFKSSLLHGISVLKHGRVGEPKLRVLSVDAGFGRLEWGVDDKPAPGGKVVMQTVGESEEGGGDNVATAAATVGGELSLSMGGPGSGSVWSLQALDDAAGKIKGHRKKGFRSSLKHSWKSFRGGRSIDLVDIDKVTCDGRSSVFSHTHSISNNKLGTGGINTQAGSLLITLSLKEGRESYDGKKSLDLELRNRREFEFMFKGLEMLIKETNGTLLL